MTSRLCCVLALTVLTMCVRWTLAVPSHNHYLMTNRLRPARGYDDEYTSSEAVDEEEEQNTLMRNPFFWASKVLNTFFKVASIMFQLLPSNAQEVSNPPRSDMYQRTARLSFRSYDPFEFD